ncbi:hypothetical protein PLEOSDRAFT_1085356 [Pleurotus ostreatus PC15]|uniref:DUF6534 domain-containing protein n=1 Tax=Pleurotus ostreatus (strain PC15) TaxID=1137138 RepID=A0A067NPQ2_PLEO1|nr:hypothetical protein PLEOSDRAFT_1085356 [Pleurotus ostreatus PC15]
MIFHLSSICFCLLIVATAGTITATICTASIREFARLQELKGAIMTWLFSLAIADIIITTSLLVHLYRKKTGVKATDNMINKIMWFTLQTGLLTSIFASLDVILFIAIPLYTNSLLSSLNTRVEYKKMKVDHLSVGNTTGAEGGATDLQQIPGETQRDPASPGGRSDFKVDLGLDGGTLTLWKLRHVDVEGVKVQEMKRKVMKRVSNKTRFVGSNLSRAVVGFDWATKCLIGKYYL